MKAFALVLILAAVASAAPVADSPEKREAVAEPTLNTRVGQFSPDACYGDWCEKKREVTERSAKEARRANAKTINTRVNGSQNYTGPGNGKKRGAKTVNTRVNGSQNYTGPGNGKKREAEAED
ncbi:hypothetical protein SLS60_011506 [Paraconiothyrium brasiliense]|uniref:Uncharacterized protein n=1 Tax=Paraconiothyrium brasiliense TaxID=300254 RepID=A0ABR3QJ06_9PLEO